MEFQIDPVTDSPVVLFRYPSNEPTGFEYLSRSVKMEFGSLTDQRPAGKHAIRPWLAEEFPMQLADFQCELVALELEVLLPIKAKLAATDALIDEIVYRLYGLTPEEIALVEERE